MEFDIHVFECGNCGVKSHQWVLISYMDDGRTDGELKPSAYGSIAEAFVQNCPDCGYCAKRITVAPGEGKKAIGGEEYRKILEMGDSAPGGREEQAVNRTTLRISPEGAALFYQESDPKLENFFLCDSLLLGINGKLTEAGWSALNAAWICDQFYLFEKAAYCREKALSLFRKAREMGHVLYGKGERDCTLLAEIEKRAVSKGEKDGIWGGRYGGRE